MTTTLFKSKVRQCVYCLCCCLDEHGRLRRIPNTHAAIVMKKNEERLKHIHLSTTSSFQTRLLPNPYVDDDFFPQGLTDIVESYHTSPSPPPFSSLCSSSSSSSTTTSTNQYYGKDNKIEIENVSKNNMDEKYAGMGDYTMLGLTRPIPDDPPAASAAATTREADGIIVSPPTARNSSHDSEQTVVLESAHALIRLRLHSAPESSPPRPFNPHASTPKRLMQEKGMQPHLQSITLVRAKMKPELPRGVDGCESCRQTNVSLSTILCPFELQIHGMKLYRRLCLGCEVLIRMDTCTPSRQIMIRS